MDDPSGRTWTKKRYSSFDNSSVYKRAGQQISSVKTGELSAVSAVCRRTICRPISSVKTGELSAVYSDELARVGPL